VLGVQIVKTGELRTYRQTSEPVLVLLFVSILPGDFRKRGVGVWGCYSSLFPLPSSLASQLRIVFRIKPSVDWNGYAKHIAVRTPAAHYRVVYPRPYRINSVRVLILGRASRLDAFSAYRFQT
jgi:hypothetical protein